MPKPAGATIRSLRQKRGIKVGEFAKAVRIGRSTAHAIESADQGTSIEVLHRMATALDVDISELLADATEVAVP